MEPRAYSVLIYLLANRRRTISQDELVEQVWPGRVVGNDALYRAIKLVREALRQGGIEDAVKTVHRVGYGFVADVEELGAATVSPGFVTLLAVSSTSKLKLQDPGVGQILMLDGTIMLLSFQTSAGALAYALAANPDPPVSMGLHVSVGSQQESMDSDDPSWNLTTELSRLAAPGQVLLSAAAYELCRAQRELLAAKKLSWFAHGTYRFKHEQEDLTVFEVRSEELEPLPAPENAAVAVRSNTQDTVLGWRAAVEQSVPGRPQWVLLDCLGSGGFGEAWLAEHVGSKERRVFKFCYHRDKLRSLMREVTLFRLLRQTLGTRPDIARILDWNFTDAPYFIESELTPAGDLTQWAQAQGGATQVPLETRCGIVAQIAHALAAAHAVGVLHKDVKPANVLIKEGANGEVQAVLADFGIGTITDPEPLAAHGITAQGITEALRGNLTSSRSGTRRYQAPEILEGQPATIRADIYSLGVMAYQLLVGDLERVLAPGWEREIDDPLLCADVASMVDGDPNRRPADANVIAQQWQSVPERRNAIAVREAKARRDARDRRIRRLLVPSTAVLLIFALTMVWQNSRVNRALASANAEADRANATTAFMTRLFDAANPLFRGPEPPALIALLEEGERQINRELSNEPDVQARLWTTIGRAFAAVGEHEKSIELLENSRAFAQTTEQQHAQFVAELELANVLNRVGQPERAEALLEPAIEALGADQNDASTAILRAYMLARLARSEYLQGRVDRAIEHAAAAAQIQEQYAPDNDPDLLFTQLMAASYHVDTDDGGGQAVDEAFRKIIASYKEHHPDHYGHEFALQNYAQYLQHQGRLVESMNVAEDSVALMQTRFGAKHPFTARALYHLGLIYGQLERYDDGEAAMRESLGIRRDVLGEHMDTYSSLMDLGDLYRVQGQSQQALPYFEEGLEMGLQVLGENHIAIPGSRHQKAKLLSDLSQLAEALNLMIRACIQSAELLGESHWRTGYCESDRAALSSRLVSDEDHEALARSAAATLANALPETHWIRANASLNLALVLYAAGNYEEAERLYLANFEKISASPQELAAWKAARESALANRGK
ncbi:MAG: tetratricopeptide repeat protein [Pseudomonadota bacterium]